ncbi:MAG TPA: GNAT family N-acetyltransferase [Glycomyces sp.]|nr:GNAT family N-acetyltransferase [Glycomyces sp.]
MSFTCYRDAWGIPHLRASDPLALAYAQGWDAATDRAWQLETLRRRATGTSAALLGDEWVHWDRLSRQAQVAETAETVFAALDAATAVWVEAFVSGVNSGLARGAALAPELDETPRPWAPWIPLAIWHAEHLLFGAGFPAKLWRRLVREALGEEAVGRFAMDGPEPGGSNGWMLDGTLTASGLPLLAGDPHRFIQLPGAYQQIRLACDEFDVVGLAMPGVPGVAHFGHTGGVAWGITNAMADTQDLFGEQLRRNPDGSIDVLHGDRWEPARSWTETITVAGEADTGEEGADRADRRVEIIETARGPIVSDGLDGAFSLRGPVQALPDLGFAALPKLLRASTVEEVDAALDDWVLPVNVVMAADTAGRTLHRVAGRVPERDDANLRCPVPAGARQFAWTGWKPMPRSEPRRLAVMANDRGLAAPLGVEFCPPHRADRIRELLEERDGWTGADMAEIHSDTLLPTADVLLRPLSRLQLSPRSAQLLERLRAWDRRMEADSTEAAAFAMLRAGVVRRIAELPRFAALVEQSKPAALFAPWFSLRSRIGFALEYVLAFIDAPEREAVLRSALHEAAESEPVTWGATHRLVPWRDLPPGAASASADLEPLDGTGGDVDCVLSTSGLPGVTEHFTRGPAARWVWDLADREQSRWIVPFGSSGLPGPHYRDQFPLWQRGELVPVVTDWNQLHEEHRMIDRPAVFEQHIGDFGRVAIVSVRPTEDIDLIYGWVTEERAKFWGMTSHSREKVLEIYEYLDSIATHHAFLILRDAEPIALFQTYEPGADPVGECYEVEPGDVGAHLLVASSRGTAQVGFTGILMGVLAAYLFDDPKHLRIVVEPDTRNEQAAARLRRTGFTLGPEVQLPGKTARLAFLRREDAPGDLQ